MASWPQALHALAGQGHQQHYQPGVSAHSTTTPPADGVLGPWHLVSVSLCNVSTVGGQEESSLLRRTD